LPQRDGFPIERRGNTDAPGACSAPIWPIDPATEQRIRDAYQAFVTLLSQSHLLKLRDGRAVSLAWFGTREEGLRAAGLA
jgi:hypothetical protein